VNQGDGQAQNACADVLHKEVGADYPQHDVATSSYDHRTRRHPWNRHYTHHQHKTYAALDLGTNNCRLLIAVPAREGFRVIDAFSRIVRLGEGMTASGVISEAAMERTLEALKICAQKIEDKKATRLRLVATQACRGALNRAEFVAKVERETGLALEVVDRETEAMLATDGCLSLIETDVESAILFDVGGGSTEIVCLERQDSKQSLRDHVKAWTSLELGVVTLGERYDHLTLDREGFEQMVNEVSAHLAPFIKAAGNARFQSGFHLLGTSGTVTTLAALHLGLPRYDRKQVDGIWLKDQDVKAVIDRMIDMSHGERSQEGCIGEERADLMLAGCAIVEALRRAFPCDHMRIADRGLREGILMNMMRDDGVWHRAT
jgi:exopolyphosphatase / guanosine-5'-triphosphate,3'-diphosphate pyrophosphatase